MFLLLFPERTDYAGHYLAGFGGTLLQRVQKAAWSRTLEVDGRSVPLSLSADARAMWIAMPLLVLLIWALLRFGVRVQGDES